MSLIDKALIRAFQQNSDASNASNAVPAPHSQHVQGSPTAPTDGDAGQDLHPDSDDEHEPTVVRRLESRDDQNLSAPAPHADFGSADQLEAKAQDSGAWQDESYVAMGSITSMPEIDDVVMPVEDPPIVSQPESDESEPPPAPVSIESFYGDVVTLPSVPAPWASPRQEPSKSLDEPLSEFDRDLAISMYTSGDVELPATDDRKEGESAPSKFDETTNAVDERTSRSIDQDAGLTPDWEVDRFVWPEICIQLDESVRSNFLEAGDRLFAASQEGLNVLGVTSRLRGEGRSTIVLCLARAAAGHGARVAVVDADIAKPDLGPLVGLEAPCSWHDYLLERQPLADGAIRANADGIVLFPLTRTAAEEPIDLRTPTSQAKLRDLAAHFDLVLVDMGPLNAEPGHLMSESSLDAVLLVRDLRHSTTADTMAVVDGLHDRGVEAVGIVENFT